MEEEVLAQYNVLREGVTVTSTLDEESRWDGSFEQLRLVSQK